MERSQSSTWEMSEENRNKLVKAASTSKLLAKVVKNADRYTQIDSQSVRWSVGQTDGQTDWWSVRRSVGQTKHLFSFESCFLPSRHKDASVSQGKSVVLNMWHIATRYSVQASSSSLSSTPSSPLRHYETVSVFLLWLVEAGSICSCCCCCCSVMMSLSQTSQNIDTREKQPSW